MTLPEHAGLVAWHKADAIVGLNDGDDITSATDSGPNGYHAVQHNAVALPHFYSNVKNGLPVMRFAGTPNETLTLKVYNGALDAWRNKGYGALFIVFKPNSATAKSDPLFIQTGGSVGRFGHAISETGYTGEFTLFGRRLDADSAQFVHGGTIVAGNWYIVSVLVEWANAIARIRVNGVKVGESLSFKTAGLTSDTRSVTINIGSSGGASFFNGDIGECLWYNEQITEADAAGIENYLNDKWAVLYLGPDHIASTAALYEPTLTHYSILAAYLASTEAVYAPTLTHTSITPDFVASTEVVYAPTLTAVGESIAPDYLTNTNTLYAPTLTHTSIIAAHIASTATIYAPTLTHTSINVAYITNYSTLYAPTLTTMPAPSGTIVPTYIAAADTAYSLILLHDDDEATITTAWAGSACKPLIRAVCGEGAAACSIAESDVLLYEEHTANRLGAVDIQLKIDNTDGVYTSALGVTLTPGARAWFSLGARVAGVEYLRRRHAATIVTVTPSDFTTHPDTITITARNNWHLLEAVLDENLPYDGTTIADAVDELADLAGVIVTRDAADLWLFQLAQFTAQAGAPISTAINRLIGEVPNAQAIALGYFDSGGNWYLSGLSANPASDYALPVSQAANIAYNDDVITRFQFHGADDVQAVELSDLTTAINGTNYRVYTTDLIGPPALTDRIAQEAMNQRELYRRGYVELQPDPRFRLWHVVTVTNCAHVADNTKARIDFTTLTYRPGEFSMKIGLRLAALIATSTTLALLPSPAEDLLRNTIIDNFDTYGGTEIEQSGSTGLYWLSVIRAETGEADVTLADGAALSAFNVVEGDTSADLGPTGSIVLHPAALLDLTAEGRFTENDYIVATSYANGAGNGGVYFTVGEGLVAEALMDLTTTEVGRHFYAAKRSALDISPPPPAWNWATIHQIYVWQPNAYIDDIRIVKADPDDASTYNDTGRAWDFSAGVWHIYQDMDDIPYSLGQIDNRVPGTRYTALRVGRYLARNHFAAGVYLRADGAVGLLGFMVNASNGYEVELDSSADTLSLLKWVNGVSTVLGSIAYTSAPSTIYYLGLLREGRYLKVFVSDGSIPVFSDAALKMYVLDRTYLAGRIGLTSYGVNSRFFHVRAGSPEHALTSEYAYATNPIGHQHASGSAWTAATGTASRATFDTAAVTLEELAKRVKALIDDLQSDTLIQ